MRKVQRLSSPFFASSGGDRQKSFRVIVSENARNYWHFDKKELHRNPDTHCIKIAVQLWLETIGLIQCDHGHTFSAIVTNVLLGHIGWSHLLGLVTKLLF